MPITVQEFLDAITRYGIEFYRVYPGQYRAIVTRNDDPEKRGRIQARVVSIQETAPEVWIKPSLAGAGSGRGTFWPPEVGDSVFVSFAQGRASRPEFYVGGWYGYPNDQSEVPEGLGYSGDYPDIRGFVTRMGHKLILSEADGDERFEIIWNKPNSSDEAKRDRKKTAGTGSAAQGGGTASIKFTANGSIEITDNSNPAQTIKMDAQAGTIEVADKSGNKVTLSSTGAKIEATMIDLGGNATEPVIKGQSWFNWAVAHTHSTSMGPSGPPVPPPTPALLSQVVKVK